MSFKVTVILLLMLTLLGGYVYWTEIRGHQAREDADSKKDRIFDFKEEDVQKLEVATAAGEPAPVLMEREGADKWKVTAPLATEADKVAVEGYLSSLIYMNKQREVDDNPKDLAGYGLKEPRSHISVWLKGKTSPIVLQVGDKSAIGNSFYAMRTDLKKVVILDTSYDSSLKKGLFDFRDKKIFPIEEAKAKKITIKREKDVVVLEKVAEGWRLKQPMEAEGSKSTVEDVLRELQNLQATKIVQEEITDPKRFGLDKPQASVVVEFEGSAVPAEVLLGSKGSAEHDVFANSSLKKLVVEVSDSILKTLTKEIAEYREKRAIQFDQFQVQRLSLVYPDKTVTCAKSGESDWKLVAPVKTDADGPAVDDVLYTADALQAKQFLDTPAADLAQYGLDKPRVKLQLWQKGDSQPREVWIGGAGKDDKTKDLTYVKNPKQPHLYLVETSAVEGLFKKPEDLKKKAGESPVAPLPKED